VNNPPPAPTALGPSVDWIVATLERRRAQRGHVLDQMRLIRDAYNGDIVIPLPELDANELPSVPNMILTGLDQVSMRIASVTPEVYYPPLRYGVKTSEEKARTRRRATLAWWQHNRIGVKLRRRARWFTGYGTAPVLIRPDLATGMPRWDVRDPLSTYPAPTPDPDDLTPPDVIFTFRRDWSWLRRSYPEHTANLATGYDQPHQVPGRTDFDLVEYHDHEVTVLAVLGRDPTSSPGAPWAELERVPNRTGLCPAVIPGRITLDRAHGQFDGLIGMYQTQAKLMALEVLAVERGVFPDTYLISRPNETAAFIAGPFDGRTGQVNIVKGGDVKEVTLNPGFATTNVVDRLERAQRITGGIPPEFGGESSTNVRTGKRGDAILSAIVDFPVQEAQEMLAASLVEENRRAVAVAKAYFGDTPRSFYLTGRKDSGPVDYTPNRDFEADFNVVTYPHTGADANTLVIGLGQRVGLGTMSKRSAQEIDPMVADPELEHDRVIAEALEQALLSGLQAQAQSGQITPPDLSRIVELVAVKKKTLADAVNTVHTEAQARQASLGPPGSPEGPVPAGSPAAQPGLAQPGMGQEQPAIPPPGQSTLNLAGLLNALRKPQRYTPGERMAG